jgi:UDP-N-acetyl-2-amino-2-deoxyglucuronate dehydrogenase
MLKFAVVGVGMGGAHGANIHSNSQGVGDLVAVCDKNPERLQWRVDTYAKEINLQVHGYTDFEEMLAKEELDGVIVSTPSGLHHQQAVAAARCGVNVLVDKPLDITMAAIDQIEQAVKKAGVLCGVNYGMRHKPVHWNIKQAIDRGDFGKLLLVDVRMKWYRDQAYYDKGAWRGTWAMDGGGSLMNQGAHAMDLLAWFAGRPVKVRGDFSALNHKIETEDWASGIVEFENGVRSTISTTTNVFPKTDRTYVEVHGTKGSCFVVNDQIVDTNLESLQANRLQPAPYPDAVIDFVHAVKDKRTPLCDITQGRWSVQLILSVYESARQGKTLALG